MAWLGEVWRLCDSLAMVYVVVNSKYLVWQTSIKGIAPRPAEHFLLRVRTQKSRIQIGRIKRSRVHIGRI